MGFLVVCSGLRSFRSIASLRFKDKEVFRSLVGLKNDAVKQISRSGRDNVLHLERNDRLSLSPKCGIYPMLQKPLFVLVIQILCQRSMRK